ncbi:MAG: acetyl-CoA carboxylase biotin carboxylase subunit [Chloroflexota bacterium]
MFSKILIANRGEIAIRLIRACKEMGISTVAVYSEADANAQHVWLADSAECIGPAPASESYLCIDKLINVAQGYGCDAVHPGYGFLSENANFAEAVQAAGLTFIGPNPEAIRIMGSKTAARTRMIAANVPVVPGYQEDADDEALSNAAKPIGYPLLVKAAAGGGGKGMRVVREAEDLLSAIQSAQREAQNAFGNDTVFLEKLVENAHHIEFQIMGDQQGNIVHLFERECSIQRRHQKIIEETPSPILDDALRDKMGKAAVAAAQAVNYVNAGTVEFLVDDNGDFYFLEMNTRLQVEHPVTELVTGIDLVKTQIAVAAGQPLPFTQDDLTQRGHAIECRIYAEDPDNGFLPSIGKLHVVREPSGPGIRVDSGVVSGDEVSLHYDPMLAKLIVHGMNRADAIQKLRQALDSYVVLGEVVTNIAFLAALCEDANFQSGDTTIDFVETQFMNTAWQPTNTIQPPDEVLIAAALSEYLSKNRFNSNQTTPSTNSLYDPWQSSTNFRMGVGTYG